MLGPGCHRCNAPIPRWAAEDPVISARIEELGGDIEASILVGPEGQKRTVRWIHTTMSLPIGWTGGDPSWVEGSGPKCYMWSRSETGVDYLLKSRKLREEHAAVQVQE